jgi:methylamine dehydrogenase heavy chain
MPGVVRGLLVLLAMAGTARAQLPVEEVGRVESLAAPLSPHAVWASDPLLRRIALVDLETGRLLGVVDGGFGLTTALFARTRPELYVPETHYSRGSRGTRTDVVTVYDALSLAPTGEIVIPAKRAINPLPSANAALSDDDRFLAVFNMTPATSLSIVDLERRRFVQEIATPGCSLVYAAGPRRFAMLCSDGALLIARLDDEGRKLAVTRSRPFFDPLSDPVTEKAVRWGDRWLFVSFEGWVHPLDLSAPEPSFEARWSLLSGADREDSWRIGGRQHLAVHRDTGRLYSLVHQGGPDGHKHPGTELWIYDLGERERVQRIELKNPGFTYLGVPLAFGSDWVWPFNRLYDALLALAPNPGVGEIAVTQDERPLLVTGSDFSGSLAVYDALTGDFLRRVAVGNMTTLILQAPWQTVEATQ